MGGDEGAPGLTGMGRQHGDGAGRYIDPMLAEADWLGIDTDTVVSLIREPGRPNGGRTP